MPWEPDFIEDGAAATGASMNTILNDGASWINAVGRAGLRRGTFNHVQAGSVITQLDTSTLANQGDDGISVYGFGTFGASMGYATYGADGGTDSAGNLGTGDRILIGHESQTGPYTGPEAVVTFDGAGYLVGMVNGDRCASILCLFNVQFRYFQRGELDLTLHELMVCLQFQLNGSGTWFTIPESESFMSIEDHMLDGTDFSEDINLDIPIATLITEDTVDDVGDATTDKVTGVRAMFSVVNGQLGSGVYLEMWNLTAIPLHASDP